MLKSLTLKTCIPGHCRDFISSLPPSRGRGRCRGGSRGAARNRTTPAGGSSVGAAAGGRLATVSHRRPAAASAPPPPPRGRGVVSGRRPGGGSPPYRSECWTATERIPFACLKRRYGPNCSNPVRRIWAACTTIGSGRSGDPYPQGTRHCLRKHHGTGSQVADGIHLVILDWELGFV